MDVTKRDQRINTHLLQDPSALRSHILRCLGKSWQSGSLFPDQAWDGAISTSVMLLLGYQTVRCTDFEAKNNSHGSREDCTEEICIILNKRSQRVRQAGDLCCPGGTVEKELDPRLARLLPLPGFPLSIWPYWSNIRRNQPRQARLLSLLLATSLRESWEEMRLNPFCTRFLGPLPFQRLQMFRAVIHPMAGWVFWQKRFMLNWEVEKIVAIPVRRLLDPVYYARYRLHVPPHLEKKLNRFTQDYPCFLYQDQNHTELLWGATYRIVSCFIELIFGFKPPEISSLPLVPGILSEGYVYGRF